MGGFSLVSDFVVSFFFNFRAALPGWLFSFLFQMPD